MATRLPASQRTREELTALIEGRLSTASAKDELIKLASRLIVEEALEGEAGDALGRDYSSGRGYCWPKIAGLVPGCSVAQSFARSTGRSAGGERPTTRERVEGDSLGRTQQLAMALSRRCSRHHRPPAPNGDIDVRAGGTLYTRRSG